MICDMMNGFSHRDMMYNTVDVRDVAEAQLPQIDLLRDQLASSKKTEKATKSSLMNLVLLLRKEYMRILTEKNLF